MSDAVDTGGELGLAPLFPLRGFEGPLRDYMDALYQVYRALVYEPGIRLWGKPLTTWGEPMSDGRDQAFWHLITTGTKTRLETDRRLDLVRCARLPWVVSMLELLSTADMRVCWWRESHSRGNGHGLRKRVFVATVDFRQIVTLQERSDCVMLGMAHPLGRGQRAEYMERAATSWLTGQSGEWSQRSAVARAG